MTVNLRKMAKFNPRQELSFTKKDWKRWSLVPAETFLTLEKKNQKGRNSQTKEKEKKKRSDFKVTWRADKGDQPGFLRRLRGARNPKQWMARGWNRRKIDMSAKTNRSMDGCLFTCVLRDMCYSVPPLYVIFLIISPSLYIFHSHSFPPFFFVFFLYNTLPISVT